eukprot:2241523-Pleurochrysis_carterae.AAC.1
MKQSRKQLGRRRPGGGTRCARKHRERCGRIREPIALLKDVHLNCADKAAVALAKVDVHRLRRLRPLVRSQRVAGKVIPHRAVLASKGAVRTAGGGDGAQRSGL